MQTATPTTSIHSFSASPRRRSLGRMMTSSTMLLLVVIGTLIVVLALLILFHHNLNATKGYKLRSLEYSRVQLMLEQEVLNMQIAKSQSLETLQKDSQVQAMIKPKNPKFIDSEDSLVRGLTAQATPSGGVTE